MTRPYDLILFGATGFTGQLVADYLAQQPQTTLKWAIAGRNATKLAAVKSKLPEAVGVISADTTNAIALRRMTAQAKVVISTVGPYIKYGIPLVEACIETGTDYADITGEPEFVNHLLIELDARAREKGVRIVNCCGFDSIPHDFGAYFTAKLLPDDQPAKIEGFVSASGTFSGGTWHSAVEAMGRMRQQAKTPKRTTKRKVRGVKAGVHYENEIQGWAVPFPTIDPQIVLRSAAELPDYGSEFSYGHYIRIPKWYQVALGGVGITAVTGLAQLKPTRKLLLNLRKPGDGPDAAQREAASFRVMFVGTAGDKRVVMQVSGGDPGYGETSKMLAETGLSLAFDELPERSGILTPVVALREPLLHRLQAAGMKFEVLQGG
ncbi:MAG: saccharopine dehydrogenase family protein [Candidatus Promineifilaceae bacterium]